MAENPKNSSNQDRNRPDPQGDANKPQKPAPATTVGNAGNAGNAGNQDRTHQHPTKGAPGAGQDRDRTKAAPDKPNKDQADKDRMNRGQNSSADDPEDDNAVTQRSPRHNREHQT